MTGQPPNGSKCIQGVRNEVAINNLQMGVSALRDHVDRLEGRITRCEISVAGVATRVTMWASLGVTAATVGIQLLFRLLG